MKLCKGHKAALIQALRDNRLAEQLDMVEMAQDSSGLFDPLYNAEMHIMANAAQLIGRDIFWPDEDGLHKCPICVISETHKEICNDPNCNGGSDNWVEFAARDQVEAYEEYQKVSSDG